VKFEALIQSYKKTDKKENLACCYLDELFLAKLTTRREGDASEIAEVVLSTRKSLLFEPPCGLAFVLMIILVAVDFMH
jgi:hypothetical protein